MGVSDNSIRNFCKRNNISLPRHGYWLARSAGRSHEDALIQKKKDPKKRTKKQLLKQDIVGIFEKKKSGLSQIKISQIYNCPHQLISRILRGKAYVDYIKDLNIKIED